MIAQGQVEVLSKGVHGTDLRLALLTDGEFFGENDLVSDQPSDVTIRTITPCVFLTLSRKDLDTVLTEAPALAEDFRRAVAEYKQLQSTVNRYGERNIDLVSGFAENVEIPETFVDYAAQPASIHFHPCKRLCVCTLAYRTSITVRMTNSRNNCV